MERMYQLYSEQAREAGVLLVSSCGFDSIPNDLGTLYLQRNFQGELAYVDSYVTTTGVRRGGREGWREGWREGGREGESGGGEGEMSVSISL